MVFDADEDRANIIIFYEITCIDMLIVYQVADSACRCRYVIGTENAIQFPRQLELHIDDLFDRNAPDSAITTTADD